MYIIWIVEIINLLSIELASYHFHHHVPSDIGTDNLYLAPENTKSHVYLEKISKWTTDRQMKLNTNKTNYIIFNFSKIKKFNTKLYLEVTKLDQLQETKVLGLVLRDDLSWKLNTAELTKRVYSINLIIKKLAEFDIPLVDLVQIFILYTVRSL